MVGFAGADDSVQEPTFKGKVVMKLLQGCLRAHVFESLIGQGSRGCSKIARRRSGQCIEMSISKLVASIETYEYY